jgi:hypothetical protein
MRTLIPLLETVLQKALAQDISTWPEPTARGTASATVLSL